MNKKRDSTATSDEAELIGRCIAGDRLAHEEFYRTYSRRVAANVYRVLGHRDELEDMVQEVFVIAFRGLPKFRQEAKLSTWLYRICLNVALRRIRDKTRKPPPIVKEDPLEGVREVSPDTPQSLLEQEENKAKVYRIWMLCRPKNAWCCTSMKLKVAI